MSITTALTDVGSNSATPRQHSTSQDHPLPTIAGESLREDDGVDAITPEMQRREKFVFTSMCVSLFLAGWNDGTIGPLLPRIQHVYGVRTPLIQPHLFNTYHLKVGFMVVSIIFISGCIVRTTIRLNYTCSLPLRASLVDLSQTYI
jgi:hypothetical protein